MFNHDQMRELVSAYLDSGLNAQEAQAVEDHLKECEDCHAYLMQIKGLRKIMSGYGEEPLSPDSEQKIRKDFLGGKQREAVMKRKILISAGSVALTVVLVFTFALQSTLKRGVQGRLRDASEHINGGQSYGAAASIFETEARRTVADAGSYVDRKVLHRGGMPGMLQVQDEQTTSVTIDSMGASALPSADYDVPVVIVEPYLPQSGNGEKVIYSASAYIKVKNAQAAYDEAVKTVHSSNGFIGSANFSQSAAGRVTATIVLRVPREKFEAVLDVLRTFGDVKAMNISNADVAQRYQELTQELNNAKIVYDKMVETLKDKKTDVEKAQRIENALTFPLQRLEGLRRQLADLDNRIAMATITATFEESSLQAFLKHDFENIHEQEMEKISSALRSLALLAPLFIAVVIALLCAIAAWKVIKDKFIKKG